MFSDKKTVVYISYPSDVSPAPHWTSPLIGGDESPFVFYFSGGAVHPSLLPVLLSRSIEKAVVHKLVLKLSQGYTTRLIDSLISDDFERIVKLVKENPQSTEYRILQDLWVLSRSDILVVDCDLPSYARCGMEVVYAHNCVKTLGVSDSSWLDPWYQYHLDMIVKSPLVPSTLNLLREA